MRIKLTTLKDCDRCNRLKYALKKNNLEYSFTTCEEDPINCDNLEALINVTTYPITLIVDTNDTILKILYLVNDYNELGKKYNLGGGMQGIPLHSIEQMLHYVKNKLY
jgi:arsenate reductase-like glutaredoxin family protein